jgi:tripartite-type tricarboxylate transporter receptor subunit TctC
MAGGGNTMRAFIGAVLMSAAFAAAGQSFPSKPIRIVSVFPTGISPDTATRIVGDKISGYLGQTVVVEPRPGGNGFIAIGAVKKEPGDGHTLLLVSNAHATINPHLFKAVPYNIEADFVPLSTIYRAPFFVAVSASGPYQTLPALIAAAKANPDRITYSTPYTGSPPHLGGAYLAHLTGTQMQAVHYKEGAAMYTSIVNGDIAFSVASLGSVTPLVKAGRLKILAIAAPERSASEPSIPTSVEAGGPKEFVVESWIGLLAPKGTPPAIQRTLSEAIQRALNEPDVMERFKAQGLVPLPIPPAAMQALIRENSTHAAEIIKRTGLKAE